MTSSSFSFYSRGTRLSLPIPNGDVWCICGKSYGEVVCHLFQNHILGNPAERHSPHWQLLWRSQELGGRAEGRPWRFVFSVICRVQALLLWNHVVPRTDIVSRSSDVKRQHKVGNGCDHSSEQRFSVPLGLRTGAKRQNGAVHPVGRSIPIGLCLLECVPL